jgi:tetratricopeptide (TPR) repeat protein
MDTTMRQAAVITRASGLTQVIARGLAALGSGSEVTYKETAAEALSHFANRRPDFVVFDWSLCGAQDACGFLQRLRKISGCRNVPIILFAKELSTQLLSIGTEYGVAKSLQERALGETLAPAVESVLAELSKPSSLRSHLVRLELAAEKEAFGEVDRIVEDFYHLYPEHPRSLVEFANLCIRRGNWNKARQVSAKAAEKFPDNLRVVNLTARLDMHEGKRGEALRKLEQADLVSPKNLERLVLFGDVFRTSGDNDTARAYYGQALEVDDGSKDAKKGLGLVELTEGDVNAALELFRDAASEEEIGGFFNNTAILAVRSGEFEKAGRLYEAARGALRADPLRAKVTFNLGLAYRKWNKPAQAAGAFVQALRYDAEHEKAQKALAEFPEELVAKVREKVEAGVPIAELGGDTRASTIPLAPEDAAVFETMESMGDVSLLPGMDDGSAALAVKSNVASGIRVRDDQKRVSPFAVKVVPRKDTPAGKATLEAAVAAPVDSSSVAPKQERPAAHDDGPPPPPPKFLDDEEDF